MYDGYFGGKGRLDGAANAASDLSYDGGHFEFISKTGGEGGSKVDFSAKNDLAAKADAAASGSQVADVIVSGDEGQGSMTKMIYVPGKISGWSRCRRTDCRTVRQLRNARTLLGDI